MLSSLTSGVSGLDGFQQDMDVIGNNIANINTTGYKANVVNFADAFSNTLRSPSGGTGSTNGSNAVQVGTGVTISGINNNWTQGAISGNGISSNVAISGNGFFTVKDPVTANSYVTRDGSFGVDSSGYLVTDNGDRVQGYTDTTLATTGDIKIDTTGSTSASGLDHFSVDSLGRINVVQTDGTTFVRGQILMQNIQDPQKLVSEGNNLFSNLTEAGASGLVTSGMNGTGTIKGSALELSNVDLSNEMANLITAQRAFEANSKIITTSNEVLQTVVNMKQG